MIKTAVLNPNEDLSPATVEWNKKQEDFIIDVPKGITRADLIALVDEIKRLTQWVE